MNPLRTAVSNESRELWWLAPLIFIASSMLYLPYLEGGFNEEFSIVASVEHLLQTGEYYVHDWLEPNPRMLIYLAAGTRWLIGGEYASLHVLSMVLMLVLLITFYGLARKCGCDQWAAAGATVLLLSVPLQIIIGVAGVSDTPALTFSLAAIFSFGQALRTGSPAYALLGSSCAAAFLCRQNAVIVPIAVLCTVFLSRDRKNLSLAWVGAALLPLMIALAFASYDYQHNMNLSMQKTLVMARQQDFWSLAFFVRSLDRLAKIAIYCGVFLLPFAAAFFVTIVANRQSLFASVFSQLRQLDGLQWASLIAFQMILGSGLWIVSRNGIVLPVLPWFWNEIYMKSLEPYPVRVAITAFSLLYAMWLLAVLSVHVPVALASLRLNSFRLLLTLFTLGQLALLLFHYQLGDKYLLAIAPGLVMFLTQRLSRKWTIPWRIVIPVLCVFIAMESITLMAIAQTQSLLAREARKLTKSGVPPARIDINWTWCARYRFSEYAQEIAEKGLWSELHDTESIQKLHHEQAHHAIRVEPRETSLAIDEWSQIEQTPFRSAATYIRGMVGLSDDRFLRVYRRVRPPSNRP